MKADTQADTARGSPMNPEFMREAIRLSFETMRQGGGGPFGAVIVRDGRIIGRGRNQVISANDPTAHAEVAAIRAACRSLGRFHLDDCVLYTSCEPCPMCLSAIYWAHIPRVFFANTRRDARRVGFDDDLIYREVGRPRVRRRLAMQGMLRDEALGAFREWAQKPDRVAY